MQIIQELAVMGEPAIASTPPFPAQPQIMVKQPESESDDWLILEEPLLPPRQGAKEVGVVVVVTTLGLTRQMASALVGILVMMMVLTMGWI